MPLCPRHAAGIVLAAAALACTPPESSPPPEDGRAVGGKADELSPNAACFEAVLDKSNGIGGTGLADLAALKDPIAQHVLKAENFDCPTTSAEMIDILRKTDVAGCEDGWCPRRRSCSVGPRRFAASRCVSAVSDRRAT